MTFPKGQRFIATPAEEKAAQALPSMPRRIVNAAAAFARTVVSVAKGNPLFVSERTEKARGELCAGCEFFRGVDSKCAACGCPARVESLRDKLKLFAEFCPRAKWMAGEMRGANG